MNFGFYFRSSVSSSREGSQERRLNDDFQSRPPLSRRPSWRRQSAVLQKARKFEAAYLKSQEIQKYKMRNSNGSNNRFLMILIFLQFSSFCMKIQILEKNTGWPDEFCIIIFKKKLSNSKFEFEKIRQKIRQNERSFALLS